MENTFLRAIEVVVATPQCQHVYEFISCLQQSDTQENRSSCEENISIAKVLAFCAARFLRIRLGSPSSVCSASERDDVEEQVDELDVTEQRRADPQTRDASDIRHELRHLKSGRQTECEVQSEAFLSVRAASISPQMTVHHFCRSQPE